VIKRGAIDRGSTVYENFEKKGVVEKRGEEETKSMPHVPVVNTNSKSLFFLVLFYFQINIRSCSP
jgi:hypothetical protein